MQSNYQDKPGFIHLQGVTSAYLNFREALNLGKNDNPEMETVLFVMCIHNFGPYVGFRLNTQSYSAHHNEN